MNVTVVDAKGETKAVLIDYVMREVDGAWRMRDVIAERVSMAKNFRHELEALHTQGGIDQVIAALQKRLAAPGSE